MADLTPTQRTQGLATLMESGGKTADIFSDLDSKPVDPNAQIRAYRGENLIKSLGQTLGTDEAAGRWYGYTPDKAARYPFDRAPSIMGGAVTRTMDVTPLEIVDAFRNAQYDHGKTMLNLNLEKGVPRAEAEDVYYRFLNRVDDFVTEARDQVVSGKMPSDRFDFMLKTTMAEGVFDKKGSIDIGETFKRGNVGIAGALAAKEGAAKILPSIARGFGLAALPLDLIAGANQTGLDPQEEIGKAYGIDPSVFYQMDPEEFQKYKDAYELEVARQQQAAIERRSGRNRARVGKDFVDAN